MTSWPNEDAALSDIGKQVGDESVNRTSLQADERSIPDIQSQSGTVWGGYPAAGGQSGLAQREDHFERTQTRKRWA